MSSVEADGLGTPEDSCLSWEGGVGTDETNSLVIAEDMKPPAAAVFPGMQGNGTIFDSRGNQGFEGCSALDSMNLVNSLIVFSDNRK